MLLYKCEIVISEIVIQKCDKNVTISNGKIASDGMVKTKCYNFVTFYILLGQKCDKNVTLQIVR